MPPSPKSPRVVTDQEYVSMSEKTVQEQCDTLAGVSWSGVWHSEGIAHAIVHTPGFACPIDLTDLVGRAADLLNLALARRIR